MAENHTISIFGAEIQFKKQFMSNHFP